jgi:hypothetical protein
MSKYSLQKTILEHNKEKILTIETLEDITPWPKFKPGLLLKEIL